MIRIKAIGAVVLAAMGGATMGTDAYLFSKKPAPVRATEVEAPKPPVRTETPRVAPPVVHSVVVLPAVTIKSRLHVARSSPAPVIAPRLEAATPEWVPCSNWRSLESGPDGHGVRGLCMVTPSAEK